MRECGTIEGTRCHNPEVVGSRTVSANTKNHTRPNMMAFKKKKKWYLRLIVFSLLLLDIKHILNW